MKKFITILLTITIAFGLLACSSSNVDKQNNNDVTEPISTEKIEEGNNECDTPEEDKENYTPPLSFNSIMSFRLLFDISFSDTIKLQNCSM